MQASIGQEKLSMSNKRKAEGTNNQSFLKGTAPNKRAAQVGSSPRGHGVSQLSVSTKRTVEIQSKSSQMGVSSEKMPQVECSLKKSQSVDANAGAFDSVRARLRESLAAALTLVSQSTANSSDLRKESENEATVTTTQRGETKCLESGSSTALATNIESVTESCGSSGPFPSKKCCDVESSSQEVHLNMPEETPQDWKYVDQEFQAYSGLPGDDTTFSNGFFFKDELLQGNGLSWALELDTQIPEVHEVESTRPSEMAHCQKSEDTNEPVNRSPESVALEIELELFRLFGGVNKKYKEKGRSLLFNLKDRNNPELRERVMSGEISPERLCSMTAEELASKELSQWRMAKAEELDQMKVLPDSEVGVRRLVKKTHKGEYQVEFDQDDAVVEDASLSVVSEVKSSSNARHRRKADEAKEHRDGQYKITIPGDGADMQGLMVDDLRDLPPILSLDEFMESLDKEPPFENMSVDPEMKTPASDEKNTKVHAESISLFKSSEAPVESNVQNKVVGKGSAKPPFVNMPVDSGLNTPVSDKNIKVHADFHSPLPPSKIPMESIVQNNKVEADGVERQFGNMPVDPGVTTPVSDEKSTKILAEPSSTAQPSGARVESILQTKEVGAKSVKPVDEAVSVKSQRGSDTNNMGLFINMEYFWKGVLQLNPSSAAPVTAIYRSGEKASTKEWPDFIEIKGRVRLDPFDKFLQELPKSRSRAIMVAHFVLKNGCTVGERANLMELIDSYMLDQRLGFAEPNTGIELYLCPPNSKPVDLVIKHLPKEYTKNINDISTGLIGILVWRKDRVTNVVPPNSSQVKLVNKAQPLTYGRQLPDKDVIHTNVSFASRVALAPPSRTNPSSNNEDDDVPPGFGPPGGTQEDDDLPEFDFVHGTIASGSRIPYQRPNSGQEMNTRHLGPGAPSQQMKQLRELIQKYGQGGGASAGNGNPIQPWKNVDDDDDDMPEWNPEPALHPQQLVPPQPSVGHLPRNPMLMSCMNRPFVQIPLDPLAKPMQPLEPPMMRHGTQWGSSHNKIPPGTVSGQHTGGHLSKDRKPPNAASGRSRGF